ncbi:MAG: hypothetical protein Q9164_004679, partial [Protoblastenia rupestris]
MPSNKHFYCVSVLNFDKPAILWEKSDCTGKKCFVPGAGEFGTWVKGAQANCVEIDPVSPVNANPCRSPGQTEVFPPNGGFPSDVPEPVGGTYGLPASFDNSHTCDVLTGDLLPQPIERAVGTRLNIDHVVELDMIVSYFTSAFTAAQGCTENQWNLVKDFIESQGLRAVSGLTCAAYFQFAQLVGGLGNLRGIDNRSYARGTPNWRRTWTRLEARATLNYFLQIGPQVGDTAFYIGRFLDGVGGVAESALAVAFARWTTALFIKAVAMLREALAQSVG